MLNPLNPGLQLKGLFSNFAAGFEKPGFLMWTIEAANIHNINKIHDFHSWGAAALI